MGKSANKHIMGLMEYIAQKINPVVKTMLVTTLSQVRINVSTNCISWVALDVRSPTVLLSRNVKDFDWTDL